jgi:hypothetical protein
MVALFACAALITLTSFVALIRSPRGSSGRIVFLFVTPGELFISAAAGVAALNYMQHRPTHPDPAPAWEAATATLLVLACLFALVYIVVKGPPLSRRAP